MIRNILIGITLAVFCLPAMAQSDAEKKAEITRIKKSDVYVYSEATLATPEDAKALAEVMFYNEVNSWVKSKQKMSGGANISVKDYRPEMKEIALPRGNMFRSFIYVHHSDIIDGESVGQTQQTTVSDVPSVPTTVAPAEPLPEAVAQVVKVQKFSELKPLITSLKQNGKISEYNLYSALQNPADYYLIVCNRQQDVVAVLTPDNGGRKNLKTGQPDAVSNYSWHGATIAFKLK